MAIIPESNLCAFVNILFTVKSTGIIPICKSSEI